MFIIRPFSIYFYNTHYFDRHFHKFPPTHESFSKINASRGIYAKIFLRYPISVQKPLKNIPFGVYPKKSFQNTPHFTESGVLACNFSTYTPERNIDKLSEARTGSQREIFFYVPPHCCPHYPCKNRPGHLHRIRCKRPG